jgi:DNA-binding response OmpR family regulator
MQQLKRDIATGHNYKDTINCTNSLVHNNQKTILVIEDDESIGELIMEVLSQETRYDVLLATDAFQALHIIDHITPCLMITDYRLPRMNGIELCDHFHSTPALSNTPVIIMSAHLPLEEVNKRHLVCMDKPFDLDDLLKKVEGALCA